MASPLTVVRNDYHSNPKPSTVRTPIGVAQFLFDILNRDKYHNIFDPAIGNGRLTDPWAKAGCRIAGCDIKPQLKQDQYNVVYRGRFEDATVGMFHIPDLVLCNPPFNGAEGKQLYPEVFLKHIFDLWGQRIPTVMFMPMGFRLNQRCKSKRWRWLRDSKAKIKSIVSLPLDVFPGVEFHAEILIFNATRIRPHYFLPEEALR
jgi:predicted RNA methylase